MRRKPTNSISASLTGSTGCPPHGHRAAPGGSIPRQRPALLCLHRQISLGYRIPRRAAAEGDAGRAEQTQQRTKDGGLAAVGEGDGARFVERRATGCKGCRAGTDGAAVAAVDREPTLRGEETPFCSLCNRSGHRFDRRRGLAAKGGFVEGSPNDLPPPAATNTTRAAANPRCWSTASNRAR